MDSIKVRINKIVKIKINVKFPHYYEHDLNDDFYKESEVIYGKITEKESIKIHEIIQDGKTSYNIEIQEIEDHSLFGTYLTNNNSNEKEFLEAWGRAQKFHKLLDKKIQKG